MAQEWKEGVNYGLEEARQSGPSIDCGQENRDVPVSSSGEVQGRNPE